MTTHDWIMLGRRAVACEGFRWIPGMLNTTGQRLTEEWVWSCGSGHTPDLRDLETKGCLLRLVREALGDPLLYVEPEEDEDDGSTWYVWATGGVTRYRLGSHRTEAAALVTALEAAND